MGKTILLIPLHFWVLFFFCVFFVVPIWAVWQSNRNMKRKKKNFELLRHLIGAQVYSGVLKYVSVKGIYKSRNIACEILSWPKWDGESILNSKYLTVNVPRGAEARAK